MLATMLVTVTTAALQVLTLTAVVGLGMVGVLLLPWTEAEQADTVDGLRVVARALHRAVFSAPAVLRHAAARWQTAGEAGQPQLLLRVAAPRR